MIRFPVNTYGFDKYDKSKYYVDRDGNESWQDIPSYDKRYSITINVNEQNNDTVPYYTERFALTLIIDNSVETQTDTTPTRGSTPLPDSYFGIPERDHSYIVEGLDPINIINHIDKWSAYAYYDTTLHRLSFFRGSSGEHTNNEISGNRVYFTDIEECEHSENSIPWNEYKSEIESVRFLDPIFPISTAYWFSNMPNLNSIQNIHHLDTSNVSNFDSMFKNCSSLKTLDLSYFNTYKVRIMDSMFKGCSNLNKINMKNFKFVHTYSANNMFDGCSKIQSSIIIDRIPIEHINMFANCATALGSVLSVCDTLDNNIIEDAFDFENNVTYGGNLSEVHNLTYSVSDTFDYNETAFMYIRGGDNLLIKNIQSYYTMQIGVQSAIFSTYDISIQTDAGIRSTDNYFENNISHNISLNVIALQTQAYAKYDDNYKTLNLFRCPKIALLDDDKIYTNFEKLSSEPGWVSDNLEVDYVGNYYSTHPDYIRPISTRNWFRNIQSISGTFDLSITDTVSNMVQISEDSDDGVYIGINDNHIYDTTNMISLQNGHIGITGLDELSNDRFEYYTSYASSEFTYYGNHMRMLLWEFNGNVKIILLSPYNTVDNERFYWMQFYDHSSGCKYGYTLLNSYHSSGDLTGITVLEDEQGKYVDIDDTQFSDWLSVNGGSYILNLEKLKEKLTNYSASTYVPESIENYNNLKIYRDDLQIYSSSISNFIDSLDNFTHDYYNYKFTWGNNNEYSCFIYNITESDKNLMLIYDVKQNGISIDDVKFVFSGSGQDDIVLYPDGVYSVWAHSTAGMGLNYIPFNVEAIVQE